MPSSCPKCRAVLEEDEICCAQVRYSWRCKSCFKLTTGLAVPYGKCFLCGGDLDIVKDRDLGDPMRLQAVRQAVQLELNSFHFYKLARDKAGSPEQSWYALVLVSTEKANSKDVAESGDARSGRRWETMTRRGEAGAGGEVGEAGDATDMTRGRRSGVGDGRGTSSSCRQA